MTKPASRGWSSSNARRILGANAEVDAANMAPNSGA